jgi:hypothetical protein
MKINKLIILLTYGCILSNPIFLKGYTRVTYRDDSKPDKPYSVMKDNKTEIKLEFNGRNLRVSYNEKHWNVVRVVIRFSHTGELCSFHDTDRVSLDVQSKVLEIKKSSVEFIWKGVVEEFKDIFKDWYITEGSLYVIAQKSIGRTKKQKKKL